MLQQLLCLLILLPFGAALLCLVPWRPLRTVVVPATGAALAAAAVLLVLYAPFDQPVHQVLGLDAAWLVRGADLALLVVMAGIGLFRRSLLVVLLALAQLGLVIWLEFFLITEHATPHLKGDNLALILVLIVSVVGSLICVYALPYMKRHTEQHKDLPRSTPFNEARFFAHLMLFLGAMNGLVLSDDLTWLYFFFELTTLCSYLLIGHDKTELAVKNAVKALWMNSLGGLAFAGALVWGHFAWSTMELSELLQATPGSAWFLVPVALLCLAGMVKAAQLPFQSWLLGAMVAPTPTSALLHSSTMVKAGVYIVLRLAPLFTGTHLGLAVALAGGFTFFAAGGLAVGQRNGKKILAYSTVSNLGLILVCAGINTPVAVTAAMLLMVFHAATKGLLFLCVGAVEQEIGSRDVEDMRDLYARMPVTSLFAVAGILAMILPPFGMLLGKWLAIESAAANPALVLLLCLGSALTVVYWARWAGGLLGHTGPGKPKAESQALTMQATLFLLTLAAVFLGLAAPWLFERLQFAMIREYNSLALAAVIWIPVDNQTLMLVYPLYGLAALGFLWTLGARSKGGKSAPYMAGAQTARPGEYLGPMNAATPAPYLNAYVPAFFGEERWTPGLNLAAGLLLALVFVAAWYGGLQ